MAYKQRANSGSHSLPTHGGPAVLIQESRLITFAWLITARGPRNKPTTPIRPSHRTAGSPARAASAEPNMGKTSKNSRLIQFRGLAMIELMIGGDLGGYGGI